MKNEFSIYSETFTIEYGECDKSGLARLTSLAARLQNMALKHDLLLSHKILHTNDIVYQFAILRSNFRLIDLPKWRDEITIKTWLAPLETESRFIYRNYSLYNKAGSEIGHNTFKAFYLDLKERKAKPIPKDIKKFPTHNQLLPTSQNSKIIKPKNIIMECRGIVKPTDLDMYDHVNNNRYLHWAINSTPVEIQQAYYCTSMEIQFRMELHEGQEFSCRTEMENKGETTIAYHLITRKEDNKEISRLLTKWAKY